MSVVALALSDGVPLYELAAPCAIFGTDRSEMTGTGWYDFRVCGRRVDRWFRSITSARDPLGAAMAWALDNITEPITVEDLAARAHLTPRSLHSHFRQRIGTNPLNWLHEQRLRRAQELLERTHHGIDLIARQSGFANAATLRRHFRQALDTTPDSYRRTFSGRPAGPGAS